jgi:nitroreductase
MEFFDALKARHSVRAYADMPVEAEKLDQILETVNLAPSAGNLQAFEVYIVTRPDHDQRSELVAAASGQDFLKQAPVVLVFCAHAERSAERYGKRGIGLYCIQDATIACTYAMLAASALGLSTVWVGAFNESEVGRIINAPQAHRPVAMLPIGYAAEEPRIRCRRSLNDLMHKV